MATKSTTATKKAGQDYVQALSPFRYGKLHAGRGQVFKLEGKANDEVLIRLRYVLPVKRGIELVECGTCGALFLNHGALTRHGDLWHTFECECGWRPAPSAAMDKEGQMRQHLGRCPIAIEVRQRAHKDHVEVAKEHGKQSGLEGTVD